jgi:dihydrofolate synthase / folylpolyglutamate synthase
MTPRERLFALEQFGIKLGLDNIITLLGALGRPDRATAAVHIAGTNGKGSVTAMVERGLRAAGHRTGRYTSPHLFAIEERVAIDGEPVTPSTFDSVTADVLTTVDALRASGALAHDPTFFEVSTAIAFEIFRRERVTCAVIEVGLGGRHDATNVITPVATAITSIAFDHERHLGSTLEEIAREKAGIIKPGVPVVLGDMADAPRTVIEAVAHERHVPVITARRATAGTPLQLGLEGGHQHGNAAVAVELLRLLGAGHDHIVTALTDVEWPARLEWLRLGSGGELLLDAAHNPAGAQALAEYVRRIGPPLPLIISVMRDKDVGAIVKALAPAASRFVAVTADSPRALPASELAAHIQAATDVSVIACPDVHEAIGTACRSGQRAIAAGSIFLVGPLRARLLTRGAITVRYPSESGPFFLP